MGRMSAVGGLLLGVMLSVGPSASAQIVESSIQSDNHHFGVATGLVSPAALGNGSSIQQAFQVGYEVEASPIWGGGMPSSQKMVVAGSLGPCPVWANRDAMRCRTFCSEASTIARPTPGCGTVANSPETTDGIQPSPPIGQTPRTSHVDAIRSIPRAWKLLTLASGAAVTLDMTTTTVSRLDYGNYETDPLARPIVDLPTPAYFAVGYTEAAAIDWLGLRMYRSHRWHRVWWLPQTLQIADNLWGAGSTIKAGL